MKNGVIPFASSKEENLGTRIYGDGFPENMPFIDDGPSITTTSNSLVKRFHRKRPAVLPNSLTSTSTHMACDSTQNSRCSVGPDNDTVKSKTSFRSKPKYPSLKRFLPITNFTTQSSDQPLTPESQPFTPVNDRGVLPVETWVLNHCIPTLASSKPFSFESQVPGQHTSGGGQTGNREFSTLSPVTLETECEAFTLEEDFCNRRASSANLLNRYGCAETDCRSSSPESEASQCSFSFLELFFSEPIRAQLMSQYCDYFLLYSKEEPPSPPRTSAAHSSACSTEVIQGNSLRSQAADSHPNLQKSGTADDSLTADLSGSQYKHIKCNCALISTKTHLNEGLNEQCTRGEERVLLSNAHVSASRYCNTTLADISVCRDFRSSCSDHKHLLSVETSHVPSPKPAVFHLVERSKYLLKFPCIISVVSNTEPL